ncbi:MAG TPA: hypothetical protein VJN43_08375 [Bryobacteraceae bacterium]|nr:hypothetical protein [Bryobacteraceae bacterium]
MRFALALIFAAVAAAQQPDAREIMRRSVEANDQNWKIARNYTFLERVEEHQLDSAGRIKTKEIKTFDVTLLEGSPYRRLVERDDHPLTPEEEKKEQEKLTRSIAERSKETPAAREHRIAEYEKRREREREMMREVSTAFDFRMAGTEHIDGRDCWIVEATPHAGYQPHSQSTKVLPHLRGKLWVDRQTLQWAKVDAEVISPVSWGLFLLRLDPGAHIGMDQTRVNDEVWLPKRVAIHASARIGFIKSLRIEQDVAYRNFRKFQTDSRIVATHPQ